MSDNSYLSELAPPLPLHVPSSSYCWGMPINGGCDSPEFTTRLASMIESVCNTAEREHVDRPRIAVKIRETSDRRSKVLFVTMYRQVLD